MRARTLLTILLFVVALAGCDWTQRGFSATHAGFNPSEPALTSDAVTHLAPVWQRNLVHGPVVGNGRLFATASGTPNYDLLSLDPATGAIQWQVSTGSAIATGPVVSGSTVYIVTGTFSSPPTSSVKAFDAATGAFKWATPPTAPNECKIADIERPPTVDAGLVTFATVSNASSSSAACAFDATTGAFKWSATVPGDAAGGGTAVTNGKVYVASSDFAAGPETTVRALDATNGAVVWTKTVGAVSTPAR